MSPINSFSVAEYNKTCFFHSVVMGVYYINNFINILILYPSSGMDFKHCVGIDRTICHFAPTKYLLYTMFTLFAYTELALKTLRTLYPFLKVGETVHLSRAGRKSIFLKQVE